MIIPGMPLPVLAAPAIIPASSGLLITAGTSSDTGGAGYQSDTEGWLVTDLGFSGHGSKDNTYAVPGGGTVVAVGDGDSSNNLLFFHVLNGDGGLSEVTIDGVSYPLQEYFNFDNTDIYEHYKSGSAPFPVIFSDGVQYEITAS